MNWIVVALLGFFGIVWLLSFFGKTPDGTAKPVSIGIVMPATILMLALAGTLHNLGFKPPAGRPHASQAKPGSDYARQAAKREAMKGGTVKDAHWSTDGSFWITLIDDGTRRDGYAQAVCQIVRDAGVRGPVTVTAWEAFAMNRGDFKELGKARCR